jgi:hypothetical protein
LLLATEPCNRALEIRLRVLEAQGSYRDPLTGCPYSLWVDLPSLSSQMAGRFTPGHMQRRVYYHRTAQQPVNSDTVLTVAT